MLVVITVMMLAGTYGQIGEERRARDLLVLTRVRAADLSDASLDGTTHKRTSYCRFVLRCVAGVASRSKNTIS